MSTMEHKCEYCDKEAIVDSKIKSGNGWAFMCNDHWEEKGYQLLGYYRYLSVPQTNLSDEHLSLIIKFYYRLDKRDHLYSSVRNKLIVDEKSYNQALSQIIKDLNYKLDHGTLTQDKYDEYMQILSNK